MKLINKIWTYPLAVLLLVLVWILEPFRILQEKLFDIFIYILNRYG